MRCFGPNFFLLGAGRCGSTSLFEMLRQHPQIFMPATKEPTFFCSHFQVVKDPISYFRLFDGASGAIAVGEGSHAYLSNPETPAVLRLLFPDARFILIFRNPTNRARSLYQWMRAQRLEPLESFEAALEAEARRFDDPEFLTRCPQYFWNYMYVRSSYYHVQWERYLQQYPRERFFVLSLAELASDPRRWMSRIYEFLGVSASFVPNVAHMGASADTHMHPGTRARLDRHFSAVIRATEALAGRGLQLSGL